jgi:hypothetical protein
MVRPYGSRAADFLRRRVTRIAEEEVRLGVIDGEAHNLWQLPVDLEWVCGCQRCNSPGAGMIFKIN